MEQLSKNDNLRKLVDGVVSQLHYPPYPNKNVVDKSIDENSKISLTELALRAIIKLL